MEPKYKISLFDSHYVREPQQVEVSLRNLAKALMMPSKPFPVREKKSLPLWSPTIFAGNRSGANAIEISCLVFDLDDGTDWAWRLGWDEYHYIAHTSFSHSEQVHKWRIILPLEEPVIATDWKRASQAAKQLWDKVVGEGEPDSSALTDCARMYYRYATPARGDNHLQAAKAHKGSKFLRLDYSHIPKEEKKPRYHRWVSRKPGAKVGIEALFHNPEFRMGIASKVGASINGNVARDILCPQCGKREVYFSIDPSLPHAVLWPHCNRANKCQWWGRLEDLI